MTDAPFTYTPAPKWVPAPLGRRLLAKFFDLFGLNILLIPLSIFNLSYAGAAIIAFTLEVVFLRFARSPGRSTGGLRVASPASPMERPSLPRALLRTVVGFSPFLVIVPGEGIGPWRAPIDPVVSASIAGALLLTLLAWPMLFGRALQDIVAGTQVWWWTDTRPDLPPVGGTAPFPGTTTVQDPQSGSGN